MGSVPVTAEMVTTLPIFWYYRRYGMHIIHWYAAIMGCNISKKDSGIVGAGRGAFVKSLWSFDGKDPADLNPRSFAMKLLEFARPLYRLSTALRQLLRIWRGWLGGLPPAAPSTTSCRTFGHTMGELSERRRTSRTVT